jgi:hypothetical protein
VSLTLKSYREKALYNDPIDTIKGQASGLLGNIPGYRVLKTLLGSDPVTGSAVETSPLQGLSGLFNLIEGGPELYQDLQKAGSAVEKAWAWVSSQLDGIRSSVSPIGVNIGNILTQSVINPIKSGQIPDANAVAESGSYRHRSVDGEKLNANHLIGAR